MSVLRRFLQDWDIDLFLTGIDWRGVRKERKRGGNGKRQKKAEVHFNRRANASLRIYFPRAVFLDSTRKPAPRTQQPRGSFPSLSLSKPPALKRLKPGHQGENLRARNGLNNEHRERIALLRHILWKTRVISTNLFGGRTDVDLWDFSARIADLDSVERVRLYAESIKLARQGLSH